MRQAAELRDSHHPSIVTFSPKVFIPLTRLCRDSCGYCTFALPPTPGRRAYMTIEEVLEVARLGQQQGCTEALFTLGKQQAPVLCEHCRITSHCSLFSSLQHPAAPCSTVAAATSSLQDMGCGCAQLAAQLWAAAVLH